MQVGISLDRQGSALYPARAGVGIWHPHRATPRASRTLGGDPQEESEWSASNVARGAHFWAPVRIVAHRLQAAPPELIGEVDRGRAPRPPLAAEAHRARDGADLDKIGVVAAIPELAGDMRNRAAAGTQDATAARQMITKRLILSAR